MRPTAAERAALDEAAYRDQVQAELDAEREGREVGSTGAHAGLCPNYHSDGERKAWLRGWQATSRQRRAA